MKNLGKETIVSTFKLVWKQGPKIIIDTNVYNAQNQLMRCDEDSVMDWNQTLIKNEYLNIFLEKIRINKQIKVTYSDHIYTVAFVNKMKQLDENGISVIWREVERYSGSKIEDAFVSFIENTMYQYSQEAKGLEDKISNKKQKIKK